MMKPIAVYIHFPYCLYKCHYCDFNSYAVDFSDDLESNYLKALIHEIPQSIENLPPSQVTSIFFGGGTPSLFSPLSFEKILGQLSGCFTLSPSCEITIEMNPKTITEEKIRGYLKAGVNRFSLGVQSFDDRFLSPLGRLHSGEEAKAALTLLKESGAENFSLDLMFAFPGQTTKEVLEDLQEALRFEPSHLSFYNLTLEDGTLLKDRHRRGEIQLPDNEIQAQMYEEGIGYLEAQGYSAYEISNFSREGREARHNLAYWRYEDYLGLGAGAVGFLRVNGDRLQVTSDKSPVTCHPSPVYGYRWTNPKTPKDYMSYMTNRTYSPPSVEEIDYKTAAGEFWMMGLRLTEGVSLKEFEKRFGLSLRHYYEEKVILKIQAKKWLERDQEKIRLTPSGRLFANEVVSEFLLDYE